MAEVWEGLTAPTAPTSALDALSDEGSPQKNDPKLETQMWEFFEEQSLRGVPTSDINKGIRQRVSLTSIPGKVPATGPAISLDDDDVFTFDPVAADPSGREAADASLPAASLPCETRDVTCDDYDVEVTANNNAATTDCKPPNNNNDATSRNNNNTAESGAHQVPATLHGRDEKLPQSDPGSGEDSADSEGSLTGRLSLGEDVADAADMKHDMEELETNVHSVTDFPLDNFSHIAAEAEARTASRRAAREEARHIRMREIERQQKEEKEKEQNGSKNGEYARSTNSRYASRQDSDDTGSDDVRQLKKEAAEAAEKYKKAMMNNAQLDNEKQAYRYQVELLKDRLEELEEEHIELQREHKDRCRELDQKKRDNKDLHDEVAYLKQQLQHRDELIEQYGLVFVSNDSVGDDKQGKKKPSQGGTVALVTPEAAEILEKHQGNLDERLKNFADEKLSLEAEIKKLKQQLEQEKERSALAEKYSTPPPKLSSVMNGPDVMEVQMEAQRQLNDYKFKLSKAEQDITTLEGNVIRLESQVKRYKTSSENSEKVEEELKTEKRKLQRELREAQSQVDELNTANQHLQKRLDKMKSARNAMLK